MSESKTRRKPYTAAELREFDALTEATSSRNGGERVLARLGLQKFITKHGKEKCDAMWKAIQEERN